MVSIGRTLHRVSGIYVVSIKIVSCQFNRPARYYANSIDVDLNLHLRNDTSPCADVIQSVT